MIKKVKNAGYKQGKDSESASELGNSEPWGRRAN